MYDFPVNNNGKKSAVKSNRKEDAVEEKRKASIEASVIQNIPQNENALEKAQKMLEKYSNKSFGTNATKSNFGTARKFDEDDLSLDSEEENDEKYIGFEESEESAVLEEKKDRVFHLKSFYFIIH